MTFDLVKLLTYWNVMLIVAVWIGIQTTRRVVPEWFEGKKLLARLLPMAPIVCCQVVVWIPGPWLDASETAAQRVVLGTVLGAICANIHSIASRLGLHDLFRVEPVKGGKKKPSSDLG